MFCLGAFVLAVVGQEFWRGVRARRAMSRRLGRRRRSSRSCAATAAATAATSCTPAIAILFVGVAASSAFQDARDVRLAPGRARARRRLRRHLRAADRRRSTSPRNGRAREDRPRRRAARAPRRARPATLRTERSYFPSSDGDLGAVSRYFEGEATSEVGLRRRAAPRLLDGRLARRRSLRGDRRRGDAVFERARVAAAGRARGRARRDAAPARRAAIADARRPPRFRVIVSPLVTWIWLGAADRLHRRADRDLAGAAGAAPAGGVDLRGAARARARPRLSRPARAQASCDGRPARAGGDGGRRVADRRPAAPAGAPAATGPGGASAPSSRRPRRRSTARSARPSSTTAPASSRATDWRALDAALRGRGGRAACAGSTSSSRTTHLTAATGF